MEQLLHFTVSKNVLLCKEENGVKNRTNKKRARVAQWLEHWSSKPGVDSSILSSGIENNFFFSIKKFLLSKFIMRKVFLYYERDQTISFLLFYRTKISQINLISVLSIFFFLMFIFK